MQRESKRVPNEHAEHSAPEILGREKGQSFKAKTFLSQPFISERSFFVFVCIQPASKIQPKTSVFALLSGQPLASEHHAVLISHGKILYRGPVF